MSWKETNKMSLKKEFVALAQGDSVNMSELCRRFNISRQTGYVLLKRYEEQGFEGLNERPRNPKTSPNKTNKLMAETIVAIRLRHPCWGGRKIHAYLKNLGHNEVPASSTISKILKNHGLIITDSTAQTHFKSFEHEHPNSLWQSDFKGHFACGSGRCHPLTILDDHSRYCLCIKASPDETGQRVKSFYIEVFNKYGIPKQMNFDNGAPWGSIFAACRYTTFAIWLIDLGIKVSYSRPRHPQTNGKIERFHRTLKAEVIKPCHFENFSEAQSKFDEWISIYNHDRPHEAIDMQAPATRYKPSYRAYPREVLDYEYSEDYDMQNIDKRGRLRLLGRTIFVGVPFSERTLGIRSTNEDGVLEIYYRHQKLGKINLHDIEKGGAINLYSQSKLSV
jgi:transposase InsO family protein